MIVLLRKWVGTATVTPENRGDAGNTPQERVWMQQMQNLFFWQALPGAARIDDGLIEQGEHGSVLLKFAAFRSNHRGTQILPYLVTAALRMPRLTIAVVLLSLAVLASIMTYTGYLVVGVLAEHLGTGRVVAGLLLGALFARFPWISKGKLRIVGLLPKPVRRPLILSLLVVCSVYFLLRGEYVPAGFTGFATAFLLTYPWLRRAVVDRVLSSVFKFVGKTPPKSTDDMVIDGEFREKKE